MKAPWNIASWLISSITPSIWPNDKNKMAHGYPCAISLTETRRSLFAGVVHDHFAAAQNVIAHRVQYLGAIRIFHVETRVQCEHFKMVRMRLPCGRLGTDITDGATNILALFGAVLEVSIGGDVLRNAHAGGRDVVDHPVHDRIMTIDPCILCENCIGLRSGRTFG